jgi:hypothetical protein
MSASTAPASQAVRSRPAVAASVLPALKSTRLLDQLRERVRYLHYSHRTEQAYVYWSKAFIRFHRLRHPVEMGKPEVEEFLSWLASERKAAAARTPSAVGPPVLVRQGALSGVAVASRHRPASHPSSAARDPLARRACMHLRRHDRRAPAVRAAVVRHGVATDRRVAAAREGPGLRSPRCGRFVWFTWFGRDDAVRS